MQRRARTVIGANAPSLKRSRDPSRKSGIGRDQCGAFALVNRVPQQNGDGLRFVPWLSGFEQSEMPRCCAKIAKVRIEVTLAGVGELALEELVDRSVAVTRAFDVGA